MLSFTDIIGSQAVLLELFPGSPIILYPGDFFVDNRQADLDDVSEYNLIHG